MTPVAVVANLGLGPKFRDHAELYWRGLRELAPAALLVDIESLAVAPVAGRFSSYTVVLLDKDVALGEAIAASGARVVNSPESIAICDDKRRTYTRLAMAGIPIPETLILPPLYPKQPMGRSVTEAVAATTGLPAVIKEAKGSFGAQVYLANGDEDVEAISNQLADRHLLAQTYIASSTGSDLRLQVIGGEVVAAMSRHHPTDFRANLSNGGTGYPYRPSKRESELAIESARAVGGFNVGVDLLVGNSGKGEYVCEVNSNAHIWRLMAITGANIPSIFAAKLLAAT